MKAILGEGPSEGGARRETMDWTCHSAGPFVLHGIDCIDTFRPPRHGLTSMLSLE